MTPSDPTHGMFLLQGDSLVGLDETPYDSEGLLQQFLARYPDLLGGHQINPTSPRRWLLVDREVSVPDALEGAGRWSMDHLFLDQDGVPTLVEVKRSTDTRIRREVVGQLLEYAANAMAYIPPVRIRAAFEARCIAEGLRPEETLEAAFGADADLEDFWAKVDTNVLDHRIRLIFVADVIPPELARMVEYLNEQMRTTEVLAVELKQYADKGSGNDLRTLVPRVIGRTATAEATKSRVTTRGADSWTWERFADALEASSGPEAVRRARRLLDWSTANARVWWGQGRVVGGFVPVVEHPFGRKHHLVFEAWTNGLVEMEFKHLAGREPFSDVNLRLELRRRLNDIVGISIPEDRVGSQPHFSLMALPDDQAVDQLLATFDWVLQTIRDGGP